MLQNLANKPSYAKEAYMITLNPFIEDNKARMNTFLNNLCDVGDFYDTLEVRSFSLLVLRSWCSYLCRLLLDGSIHGFVEERSANQHYYERTV